LSLLAAVVAPVESLNAATGIAGVLGKNRQEMREGRNGKVSDLIKR